MALAWGWTLLYFFIRHYNYVSGQSCNVTETNITASTTEILSLTSLGYDNGAGSYSSNTECYWMIDSGDDTLRLLLFATYDLSCPNDQVSIFDGNTETATEIARVVCGKSNSPSHFATSQRYALIRFVSDDTQEKAGFKIDYLAAKDYSGSGCTSQESLTPTDTYQFLSTPGFPDTYPGDSNCRWSITNIMGTVELDVIVSDVEDDDPTACDYDKFMIYNGQHRCDHNDDIKVCSEYPGTTPYNYTSTETTALVTFESDGSVNRRGVLLRYRAIDDPTTTTSFVTTTTVKYYKTTKANELQMDTTMLLGIIFGSLVLISFTIITVVIVVRKMKVPTAKTITPVQPFRPYETIQKDAVRMRRLNVQSQSISQSGVVRHEPPW